MDDQTQPLLESLKAEVLRRVGRNLLLFQQIEGLLKFLLANHKGAGTPENFQARHKKREESISKQMLGNLVDQYGTEVLQDAGVETQDEENPAVPWASFSFRVSGNSEFVEAMRSDLKLMTEERNELVHHFIPRWKPEHGEKLEETLQYLDAQREKVLPMHEHLRHTVDHVQRSRKLLLEFMESEEYERQAELMWLQLSPLVELLREVTSQIHRPDGWTYLAHAGKLANKNLPDDIRNLKERYGFNTLKKLLIACETFDVYDEPLANGTFRTLYRVRRTN
jgi:hypothetical protein